MLTSVFVYGTLKAGQWNDRPIYSKNRVSCHKATIQGRIYAVASFPGVRLTDDGEVVYGEVHEYTEQMFKSILPMMDGLEGYDPKRKDNHYNRKVVRATLENGKEVDVYVYEYGRPVPESLRILSGNWTETSREEVLSRQVKAAGH